MKDHSKSATEARLCRPSYFLLPTRDLPTARHVCAPHLGRSVGMPQLGRSVGKPQLGSANTDYRNRKFKTIYRLTVQHAQRFLQRAGKKHAKSYDDMRTCETEKAVAHVVHGTPKFRKFHQQIPKSQQTLAGIHHHVRHLIYVNMFSMLKHPKSRAGHLSHHSYNLASTRSRCRYANSREQ